MKLEKILLNIIESKESRLSEEDIEKQVKKKIKRLIYRGYMGAETISEKMKISPEDFVKICDYLKIEIPQKKWVRSYFKYKTIERRELVREAANKGKSNYEISILLGVSQSTIYSDKINLGLPTKQKDIQETIEKIEKAISNGAKTPEEIGRICNLSPLTVLRVVSLKRINVPFPKTVLPYLRYPKTNQEIDKMIEEGSSLAIISQAIGKTRESARQYIVRTNQHEKWKEKRKLNKSKKLLNTQEKKAVLEKIVCQINEIAERQVPEMYKLSYEKARLVRSKTNNYSFNQLYSLFQEYFNLQSKGKRIGLKELGKIVGFKHAASVGRILKISGLAPLYGNLNKIKTPKYKKEALERAVSVPMSEKDIAYFLGLKNYTVNQYFIKHLKHEKPRDSYCLAYFPKGKKLSYRIASEIFLARDLGFSKEETIELLDLNEKAYEFVIKNNKVIKTEIKQALQTLFSR